MVKGPTVSLERSLEFIINPSSGGNGPFLISLVSTFHSKHDLEHLNQDNDIFFGHEQMIQSHNLTFRYF